MLKIIVSIKKKIVGGVMIEQVVGDKKKKGF